MQKGKREVIMKEKIRISKRNRKAKGKLFLAIFCIAIITITVAAKENQPKVVGYIYDTGSTVWEMAERHCPDNVDVRDFAKEIVKANGIENYVIHKYQAYKIPVYKTEGDYLDMNTVVGYEVSDNGVMLFTNDGCGYFIEK